MQIKDAERYMKFHLLLFNNVTPIGFGMCVSMKELCNTVFKRFSVLRNKIEGQLRLPVIKLSDTSVPHLTSFQFTFKKLFKKKL